MKILMVSPVFPPSIGGIEQHVLNLSKELVLQGNEVHVLTTEVGGKGKAREGKVKVFRAKTGLNSFEDLASKGKNMVLPMSLKALLLDKKFGYDLVHAHCPFSLMAAMPLKLFFGKSLVATIHGNWVNCIKGRRYFNEKICWDFLVPKCSKCLGQSSAAIKLKQAALLKAAQSADHLIAVSSDVKKSIKLKKNVPITVIPNVCSASKKGTARKPCKEFVVSFIGAMISEKGARVLAEAIPGVVGKRKDAKFNFIYHSSDGVYLKGIKEFLEKNELQEKVFFHEKIPNKKVREKFLPESHAVVIPSLWPEPCSSVATEAMNEGAVVIASRSGGFNDLVEHNKTGFLFSPGSKQELSKSILRLSGNKALSASVKKNALKKIRKELNWGKVTEKTLMVYRKAMQKSRERKK